MNSKDPSLKLRDDINNNNNCSNNHKNIAMQMVVMDHQPFSHHLIQRINQHTLLSNQHNARIESLSINGSNHVLHTTNDVSHSQEANDVKGHRVSFNHLNDGSDVNHPADDQLSCSPLSSSGDDQMHQAPLLGSSQEHSSPVMGRKRRKHSGPQLRPTCTECGKDFSNQSALSKHKLTHSDVRRFSCEICQKAFKRQDHLNGHMLTHREKKPYECDVEGCEKTYCDARSLRRHKENHHSSINVASSHPNNNMANNVASSALRSLLSGNSGVLFPHHNIVTSHHNSYSHGHSSGPVPSVTSNSGQVVQMNQSQSHDVSSIHGRTFIQGQGFNYTVNDEMPSPHPPTPRLRQQVTPVHSHPPPPIVLNQNPYNSHSVPTTPTTHPQTPVSTEPLPSPHHLSVNNGNPYGALNGHQQSHPCTPTQPVNTFSFSPHQVQQYHQQQQEQNQNSARSLPTTPTDHINSPSTPVVGYVNTGHQYHHVYSHPGDVSHAPRSLPATPADHQGMVYTMHHQQATYNDPNPSPYSVASQSSPYDLHQPASHLQNQQSNTSNYQSHPDPRHQLHSTGTYEDHDINDQTYQSTNEGNEADIDDYDISQIDVQNLMEHIQSHHQSSNNSQSLQPQSHLPSLESQQSFYPQTEPITPTTPATPAPFHSFQMPDKHTYRGNVIQSQDTHIRNGFTSIGKSMSQIMCTQQQQHVDHHSHNQQQQQMLLPEAVNHRQDVTSALPPPQHLHNPDASNFQVPSSVFNRSITSSHNSAMELKQNSVNFQSSSVMATVHSQNYCQINYPTGSFRQELRSSTPPNLVVNLSPMTSRPASVTNSSSNITITADDGFREPANRVISKIPAVVVEEGDEDDVFPPDGPKLVTNCSSIVSKETGKIIRINGTASEGCLNQNAVCTSNQSVKNDNTKTQTNLKRSHETGGVIVHGTDHNFRQQQSSASNNSSNLLLLQALQNQLSEKSSNENKKPAENSKDELRSPKRMRHKPEPIYIPPQVNAFGFSNCITSRTSRSPRIWDGKGSQMSNPVNQNAFTKLSFDSMSKISPPPYTPPPMLSPVRTSFGYYYHINSSNIVTPKAPLAPTTLTNITSVGSCLTRKLPPFAMTKDSHPVKTDADQLRENEPLEVKTPMTAYEPFPEFATSFDSERGSEGDILPHVNVGPNYQARIPAFICDIESAKEKYRHEKADLVWDPLIIQNNSLLEEDIVSYLEVACSLCIPGSGRNQEYAHHILFRANGDLQEALVMLLEPSPKIGKSDPLYGYHYSESDVWSTEDIVAYHQALVKCDKDFYAISREIQNKSVKECIQFYYLWKKVCPEEYRKLRIIRRKREQEGFHAKSITPQVQEVGDKNDLSELVSSEEPQNVYLEFNTSRSCSPGLAGSITCPESDGSSMTGFDSLNPSPAPSSTGSIINNNNLGECPVFPCKLCGKVFDKVKSRSAHMKIHSSAGKDSSVA